MSCANCCIPKLICKPCYTCYKIKKSRKKQESVKQKIINLNNEELNPLTKAIMLQTFNKNNANQNV